MRDADRSAPPRRLLLREALGREARDERVRRGERLVDVARTAALSPQYLSEVERGRKDPSSEVLRELAHALGLDPLELVRRAAGRMSDARDADRERVLQSVGDAPARPTDAPVRVRVEAGFGAPARLVVEDGTPEPRLRPVARPRPVLDLTAGRGPAAAPRSHRSPDEGPVLRVLALAA